MRCRCTVRALVWRAIAEPGWAWERADGGPRRVPERAPSWYAGPDMEAGTPQPIPAHSYIDGRTAARRSWSRPGTELNTERGRSSRPQRERPEVAPARSNGGAGSRCLSGTSY